jgi:integrase
VAKPRKQKDKRNKWTGKWQAVWWEKDRTGKRIRMRAETCDTHDQARAKCREMEELVESRNVGDPDDQTVFEYLYSWCAAKPDDIEKPIEDTTEATYRGKFQILERELPDMKLRLLKRDDLKQAYQRLKKQGGRRSVKGAKEGDKQPLSMLTIIHIHRVVHNALEDARRNSLIPFNPADDIRLPSVEKSKTPVRPFSPEEVIMLFDAARTPMIKQRFRNGDRPSNRTFLIELVKQGDMAAATIKDAFAAEGRNKKCVGALLATMKASGEISHGEDGSYRLVAARQLSEGRDQCPENNLIVSTLFATGIRREELCGLAFDDNIDLEQATIEVSRIVVLVDNVVTVKMLEDRERRVIALPPYIVEIVREQKVRVAEQAMAWGEGYDRKPLYMLPGLGGGPRDPSSVTERMNRLIERCGIEKLDAKGRKISPCHSWRHTSGSSLYDAYGKVKQVQGLLGHVSSKYTFEQQEAFTMDTYIHGKDIDRGAAAHFETLVRPR